MRIPANLGVRFSNELERVSGVYTRLLVQYRDSGWCLIRDAKYSYRLKDECSA